MKAPGLCQARDRRLMTIRELAAAAGVSTNTVSRLERGEDGYPSTIRKLAKALGVKPMDLMEPGR